MSLHTLVSRLILIPSLLTAVLLGIAPALAAQSPGPPTALEESIDGAPDLAGDVSRTEVPVQQGLAGPRAAYAVVDLGRGYASNASEINEEGHISGTIFSADGDLPVVWQGDRVVHLDRGGSHQVRAMAIADDGTVGGWEYDAAEGKRYAVTWTRDEDGEYGDLTRVSEVKRTEGSLFGGETQSLGANGLVHVTEPLEHVSAGSDLVWQAGAATELAAPPEPGPYLATNDMNNHGQVVGMAGNGSDDIQAFVWNGGSPSALPEPIPNAHITRGLAINDDGDVLGDTREVWYDADSAETIRREAGLWRNGAWTDLGNLYGDDDLAVTNLTPWDVNDHDEVVGSAAVSVDGRGTDHAFLWRNGETIDLAYQIAPETGWELNSAHSINERGQIVGLGTLDGVQRAFLLDPTRPLLFVPGMGASILRSFDDPGDPKDLWLACGEERIQLSLFKEDDELAADDVRAVDAARFLECRGLSGRDVDALDAYGTMLEKLTTTYGYREYDVDGRPERRTADGCDLTQRNDSPNLFVFAYDWRFDNALSARELADYIGCIQQFYPGIEIDVVAHSMGSLVTRRYILDHRHDTGLHKIVTIGAPWLGAPKLVDTLNTGNFTRWAAQGSSDVVRHIVGGFGAAHQLMAGPYYHQLAGSVFAEDGWDYDRDGDATEDYDWADLKKALDERWSATTPATTVEEFHTNGGKDGQADWSYDSSGEDYTVIYGIQAGRNTIGKVKAVGETFCTPLEVVCVTRRYFDQVMTQGDGTVPVTSANRTSGDDDLNGPAKLVPVPVHDSDDNDSVEHTGLTRNPKVLKTMIDTFRGVTDRAATLGADEATEAAYRYVTVRGAQDIVLHDGQGRSDAPLDGEHRITLPGSQHLTQGPDGELVTMPADVGHPWTVTFTGSGKPASVKALEGTQERPEVAVQWRDLVVPEGHAAELLLTPTGLERLRIDTDGDGNVETTVPPTSDLSGEDALDIEPPVVALAETTVDDEKRYVVSATDGRNGTGVRRVLWSTDGEHYTEYAGPLRAPLAATLLAFAEDHAGNRSAVVELDLSAASKAPVTTAALDPVPSATGWSAGATTVTLTAETGTGSEVAEIRYRATGAQPMEETIVAGDRAELRVTAPGRTTLWFQAVAGDGVAEPWQQKVLRIDAAAPTGRVLGPAPGSVVGVLGQVSGTAADDAAGVHQVEVLLERTSDGRTWDGGAWSPQTTWLPARGTTEWRMTDVPGIDHLTSGAYAVRMRATDGAGRVTVTTAVTFTQAHAGRLAVTALGTVGGRVAHTSASDINDDGTAVGGTGSFPMTANRWTSGVAGELRTPAGMSDALAHAIAADGSAAGYAEADYTRRSAVRWTAAGEPTVLPALAGAQQSMATGISTAGVVGHSGGKPVWWRDDATVVALPTLQPGQTGQASDIDSTGTIVGHVVDASGNSHAVAWTDGGRAVTDLGTLGGPYAAALGINDVGQVVGYSGLATGGMRAFVVDVREGEAMSEVYVPTKRWAQANDISDDGTIVGEYAMGDESRAAFLVTAAGEFQHLQLRLDPSTDWVLSRATGINGLGQIVGFGLKAGVGRAFLASATHAPVAQDVVADTDEDTAVAVRLAASDPDPGAHLTMEVVLQPAHGTLSAINDREVVYTPAPGFEGTDYFSYVAHDGALRSNAGMVTVRVRPGANPNQRPTAAVTAPATVPEGSTVEVDGSGSTDADGTVASYAWDLDGDGAFDDATGPTASLTLGDQGLRPVALRVTDNEGAEAVAGTTVEAVNVAPMVSLPPSLQVAPGERVRLQGTFADPGADSWTATVDSGDGTQTLSLAGKAFTVETTYAEAGNRSVTVEVCDGTDCATATTTVVVKAAWTWDGFFAPVDNLPVVNTVRAGQAIPMKFSVGGDRGLDILAPGYPVSIPHDCGTGQAIDDIEQTVTPGSATLTYDAGTQRYQYVWKTQKSWANQCRTFTLKLADGSVHSAEFRFR